MAIVLLRESMKLSIPIGLICLALLCACGDDDDNAGIDTNSIGKIAFVSNRDGDEQVFVMNADGSNPINITNHPANDTTPSWTSGR